MAINNDRITDMMRRSAKRHECNEAETEFRITPSDVRVLANTEFPVIIDGKTITLEGNLLLVEKPKAAEPEPQPEPEPADLLMWVGANNYPTCDDFVKEAQDLGITKRVSKVPKGLIPGKSRVFLVHDEGVKGDAVIFGYFTVESIEMLLEDIRDIPLELKGKVIPVSMTDVEKESSRGGGFRSEEEAMYLVSRKEHQGEVPEGCVVRGPLVVFAEPKDYNTLVDEEGRRFRNYRRLEDADAILGSTATKQVPTSRQSRMLKDTTTGFTGVREDWTEKMREALLAMVAEYPQSKSAAFRQFARETGRSVQGVSYQYYKLTRKDVATA